MYLDLRPRPAQEDMKKWRKEAQKKNIKSISIIMLLILGIYALYVYLPKLYEILN